MRKTEGSRIVAEEELAEGEQEQMKGHDGLEDQEKKARNEGRIVVLCG